MIFLDRLEQILKSLPYTFKANKLAYLAATSKIENPIRDKIAYSLHDFIGNDLLVHREWKDEHKKKADIDITEGENKAKYIIELKAHSAPTFERGYTDLIRKDIIKMFHAGHEQTEMYVVFLFNHLYHPGPDAIDKKYERSLKYFDLVNYASRKNEFLQDVSVKIKEHWERHLDEIGLPRSKARSVVINAGDYYQMPTKIHAFLYGPLFRSDVSRILTI